MHHLIEDLSCRTHGQRLSDTVTAIALMVDLQSEKRSPTPQEKETLAKFSGFGPIASVFEDLRDLKGQQQRAHDAIKAALSEDWYRRGRGSINSAYYTPPQVIPILWDFALRALQPEKKIRVIEPGCGIGNFALYAPDVDMEMVGVELEPTSAAIAKLLGWGKVFNRDFVSTDPRLGFMCADSQFDLAIGNVPFVGSPGSWGKFKPKVELHARIFLRLLELVKPGGFIVAITSTGTLDSVGSKGEYRAFREFCDRRAIFHGAVRLPQGAFKGAYQTEVCSDIIVLQKSRQQGERSQNWRSWVESTPCDVDSEKTGLPTKINEYFINYPEQRLGTLALDKLTGDRAVVVGREGQDTLALLRQALDRILQNVQ